VFHDPFRLSGRPISEDIGELPPMTCQRLRAAGSGQKKPRAVPTQWLTVTDKINHARSEDCADA
jgi:hypothetical protein